MKKLTLGLAGVGALAIPLGATLALPLAADAAPVAPAAHVSFSASNDGASAGWSNGKGSAIDLTMGSTQDSYAVITIHQVAGTPVNTTSEPTFTTNNYNAGSPRWYVTLSNGDTVWGYPPNAHLNGSAFAWAIDNGNTYEPWSAIQAAEPTATVTGAYVIADADQAPGTTDVISGLNFNGTSFTI